MFTTSIQTHLHATIWEIKKFQFQFSGIWKTQDILVFRSKPQKLSCQRKLKLLKIQTMMRILSKVMTTIRKKKKLQQENFWLSFTPQKLESNTKISTFWSQAFWTFLPSEFHTFTQWKEAEKTSQSRRQLFTISTESITMMISLRARFWTFHFTLHLVT